MKAHDAAARARDNDRRPFGLILFVASSHGLLHRGDTYICLGNGAQVNVEKELMNK